LTDTHFLPADSGEMVLDPFAFIPHLASRVIGLGGEDTSDQTYAFHTPYACCAEGTVTFTIRFANLHATVGNLTVRVNAISTAPGAVARTVKMTSRSLRELSETGELHVSVDAKPHLVYAVVGLVYGVSDAGAEGLQVILDNPGDAAAQGDLLRETRYTEFGREMTRDVARLVSGERPTLTDPVSQFCTNAQFTEDAYNQCLSAMRADKTISRAQWERVYALRVLDRYGMLGSNARGLGFMFDADPLPAIFAAKGCEIAVVRDVRVDLPPGEGEETQRASVADLRRPDICPDELFDAAVRDHAAGPAAIGQGNFDFCWSLGTIERLSTVADTSRFTLEALQNLKAGGLAVHMLAVHSSVEPRVITDSGMLILRRIDLERLAFELVSLGHQVAQFKYGEGDSIADVTSVGLIVRKGESNFY